MAKTICKNPKETCRRINFSTSHVSEIRKLTNCALVTLKELNPKGKPVTLLDEIDYHRTMVNILELEMFIKKINEESSALFTYLSPQNLGFDVED